MYLDSKSAVDSVPLRRCDDPKLKPYVFHGRQKLEFLSYLGDDLPVHVFEVKTQEQTYALKLGSEV